MARPRSSPKETGATLVVDVNAQLLERFETPFGGMFALVTKALKELRKWANENGLSEQAPYFLRYYHCDMKCMLVYRGNGLRGKQALMKWAKDSGVAFDPLVDDRAESYACRYEAYLTDHRVEPRKLLWDVELSIKIADD